MEIWEINSDWSTKQEFKSPEEANEYIKNTGPEKIYQILYRENRNKPIHVFYNGTLE